MAGAGYKLFNSGDVLTAAQVNTYLMEQTVMVFNDAAARTTALSGVLSEGMISYLKDTNAVEVYNGSAWVASDDPNAIQNTIVDAKGDLITATAADTPARLASSGVNGDVLTVDTSTATGLKWAAAAASSPLTTKGDLYTYSTTNARLAVGANGETLVADSSTTTGLRWQGDWNTGKNKIINGDFFINQRAFSSSTTHEAYGFDRWYQVNAGGTTTYTAQTFTLGTAPVAGYEGKNFLQIASTGQSAAGDYSRIVQKIESVRTFADQTITVSFWAKASSGTPSVAINVYQDFGTGGSPSAGVAVNGNKVAITTSWARYSITIAVPSISGKTLGTNNNDSLWLNVWTSAGTSWNSATNSLGIQTTTIQLWGIQAEAGSVATPFTTATGTLAGELAACQRYYWRHNNDYAGASNYTFGGAYSTTQAFAVVRTPVTMRTAPTITFQAASNYTNSNSSGSSLTNTSISGSLAQTNAFTIYTAVASGLVAGNATAFTFAAQNNYYEASSEL